MFGEKLIKARTENNLTQEQLAEKLFVTRQAVSRWENNKTQPDIQTLGRICQVLCVEPSYFIEVNRAEESFAALPRKRKRELFYAFAKTNKKLMTLTFLFSYFLSLGSCAITMVATLAIIDLCHHIFNVSPLIWVSISAALVVFAALNLFLSIYLRYLTSGFFNEWLSERGVARTKKFIFNLR